MRSTILPGSPQGMLNRPGSPEGMLSHGTWGSLHENLDVKYQPISVRRGRPWNPIYAAQVLEWIEKELDIENLGSSDPYMLKDLPAGGSRLMQKTSGYLANIVSGKITYVKGKKENVLPGKLVKLINIQEKFK